MAQSLSNFQHYQTQIKARHDKTREQSLMFCHIKGFTYCYQPEQVLDPERFEVFKSI